MNTIDSYYEYEIDINSAALNNPNSPYIVDRKTVTGITLPNGSQSGT